MIGRCLRDGSPLDARREPRAASATQPGFADRIDNRLGPVRERFLQCIEALVLAKVLERERVGKPATPERPAVLIDQIRDFLDGPEVPFVFAAIDKACGKKRPDV